MGEMIPVKDKQERMVKFFESRKGAIGQALARVGVTPDRMVRSLFTAAQKTPELLDCSMPSLYKAVLLAAQAGLMPDGVTQQAHLIPRRNGKKGGILEANLQIGYRGYLTLCRRSGDVDAIDAYLVRKGDKLSIKDGEIAHEDWTNADGYPSSLDDNGKERPIVGVWAKAKFKSGNESREWMSIAEVEALRKRSGAQGQAWDTDYGEMVKKTILRRICKRLPQSEDAARLLELDAQADAGKEQDLDLVGGTVPPPDVEAMPRADAQVTDVPPSTSSIEQDRRDNAG
jgi:recombination protein RecT